MSYQVTGLRELGMIKLVDTAPRRGAVEHYYKAVWQVRVQLEPVE